MILLLAGRHTTVPRSWTSCNPGFGTTVACGYNVESMLLTQGCNQWLSCVCFCCHFDRSATLAQGPYTSHTAIHSWCRQPYQRKRPKTPKTPLLGCALLCRVWGVTDKVVPGSSLLHIFFPKGHYRLYTTMRPSLVVLQL